MSQRSSKSKTGTTIESVIYDANPIVPYKNYFKKMPCYALIIDQDFQIIESNDRFESYFGTVSTRRCFEVCKRRDEQCDECPVERCFLDGQCHSREARFISKTGKEVPLTVNATPMFDSKGQVVSVLKMAVDRPPARQLQSKLESLGLLIGTISHNIKGLCTGLDGGIYIVNSGTKQCDEVKIQKGWAMVQRNANRLRRLVNNTLYYAKERDLHLETASTAGIHREVIATLGHKAKRLGIQLKESLNDPVGTFEADAAAVSAALVNLLENSLDACHEDKTKKAHFVKFIIKGDHKSITFEILDNGIGMDLKTRDKATDLFYSSKGAGGTGLGLYIANQIVAMHGGGLAIDSSPGAGTRMSVTLPRGHASVTDELEGGQT